MSKREMVVIAFDTEDKADEVLKTIKSVSEHINLEDTVVVRKDAEGNVHASNAVDKTTKQGATIGGLTGLFVGAMFGGPIGAMVVGGLGGGAIGALMNNGVDNKFIKEVSETIQPSSSALFMVIRSAEVSVILAAFRMYEGQVLHSSLPDDLEKSLERALKSGPAAMDKE